MPLVIGSTTLMAALVATAASKALPPCIKMRTPAIVASGWLLATIPLRDMTIERREKKRSPEMGGGVVMVLYPEKRTRVQNIEWPGAGLAGFVLIHEGGARLDHAEMQVRPLRVAGRVGQHQNVAGLFR